MRSIISFLATSMPVVLAQLLDPGGPTTVSTQKGPGYQLGPPIHELDPQSGPLDPWKFKTIRGATVPECGGIYTGRHFMKKYTFDAGDTSYKDQCTYWTAPGSPGTAKVPGDAVLDTPGVLVWVAFDNDHGYGPPIYVGKMPCWGNSGPKSNINGQPGLFCCEDAAHYAYIGVPEEWIQCEGTV